MPGAAASSTAVKETPRDRKYRQDESDDRKRDRVVRPKVHAFGGAPFGALGDALASPGARPGSGAVEGRIRRLRCATSYVNPAYSLERKAAEGRPQ